MPFMHSERTNGALRDILHHIDLATQFVEGFDRESFKLDVRAVYAVTRCLEIISEASRRLPVELKARHPTIAWKQMAAAGNRATRFTAVEGHYRRGNSASEQIAGR
jgi:uncharacterized protein with HEPN domain